MKQEIPYIWFGGKRKVADMIWNALGDVDNYIEPFFGAGAVYLLRQHDPKIETINDYDGFVANFWRAVQADPDKVADLMNWPVNEVDLEARHRWLCRQPDKNEFLERMKLEPDYYDAKKAAWWCWGLNAWIGAGWCGGNYYPDEHKKSNGIGLCKDANKCPHLVNPGQGIHRQRPHLGDEGKGEYERRGETLREWMFSLRDRLRNTRVCCGDWKRVVTDGAMSHGAIKGVFLDPPYSNKSNRDNDIYRCEDLSVAHEVREWCLQYGDKKFMRIALCGYDTEHADLVNHGWRAQAWKARGGYSNFSKGNQQGKLNKHRETIWFSPHCLCDVDNDGLLFDNNK
jgi:hypothetical protein